MNVQIINDIDEREFTKILLTDKKRYEQCTDKLKRKHFFMVQRSLAKQFPIQINKGNINGIDEVAILDSYHYRLCKDGSMPPQWLYTKGGKDTGKTKETKLFETICKDKLICQTLLKHFDIELKSLDILIKQNFAYVDGEYNRLLLMFAGKLKKSQKIT